MLPGFTAEASLPENSQAYRSKYRVAPNDGAVRPQSLQNCDFDVCDNQCDFDCWELRLPPAACARARAACYRACCAKHHF